MITVSTRGEKQGSAVKSCAYDTKEDDPGPGGPAGGLALRMLMALEIFALMTLANDGVSTSSLL